MKNVTDLSSLNELNLRYDRLTNLDQWSLVRARALERRMTLKADLRDNNFVKFTHETNLNLRECFKSDGVDDYSNCYMSTLIN